MLRDESRGSSGSRRWPWWVMTGTAVWWTGGCVDESQPLEIDGDRAMNWVEQQVAIGPRIPGTEAHAECAEFLEAQLRTWTDEVKVQRVRQGDNEIVNLVASFRPSAGDRIFLGAHWDTRPMADADPDPTKRSLPVPGANDGASGVAVLLEVARVLAESPPPRGVDLFFFDAEDGGESGQAETWAIGARTLAEALGDYRPRLGIVVDMVGDLDLELRPEGHSVANASRQVRWIWGLAEDLGADSFVAGVGATVMDDHVPFLERGIPTVDIIDFDYVYWHTTQDTPDKVSPSSMAEVGRVLLGVVYAETLP